MDFTVGTRPPSASALGARGRRGRAEQTFSTCPPCGFEEQLARRTRRSADRGKGLHDLIAHGQDRGSWRVFGGRSRAVPKKRLMVKMRLAVSLRKTYHRLESRPGHRPGSARSRQSAPPRLGSPHPHARRLGRRRLLAARSAATPRSLAAPHPPTRRLPPAPHWYTTSVESTMLMSRIFDRSPRKTAACVLQPVAAEAELEDGLVAASGCGVFAQMARSRLRCAIISAGDRCAPSLRRARCESAREATASR